jgi:GNAT superfamily N-acetyltransferase
MTLAYVFWHRPRPDVDPTGYAAALEEFHAGLAAGPPPGLLGSWSSRLGRIPWNSEGDGWFEDFYLVSGWASLGFLEEAAVDVRRRGAHDAAAAGTLEGTAGLYGLRAGSPSPPGWAAWLPKPEGESYASFAPALAEVAGAAGAAVWQRSLTLGPTPEYAVLAPEPVALPWPAVATEPALAVGPVEPHAAPGTVIRDARPGDAEALSALALRSKGHWGYDEAFLARARPELTVTTGDIERYVVRVAEQDGGPGGFSAVDLASEPAELLALFVEPALIGTGIGRALLRDARARAAAHGVPGLLVESDPNAEPFYRAHGARRLGERRSASTGRMLPLLWLPA